MSEYAKLIFLQEKIKETKGEIRESMVLFIIGFFAVFLRFILPEVTHEPSYIWILIIGVLLTIFGGVRVSYYKHKYNLLMKQLEIMAIKIPKCPKCGKQIPQGSFAFCPFCGSALEKDKKEFS